MPKFGNPFSRLFTAMFKEPEKETPVAASAEKTEPMEPQAVETPAPVQTTTPTPTSTTIRVYLKALPLRALEDVETIKREIQAGNIVILKVSPLARKSVDEVKQAVDALVAFTQSVDGDIARLGDERVVITPAPIKIWREKIVAPSGPLPTAA